MLQKLLKAEMNAVQYDNSKLKPVIATKFTPSPWRNTKESVAIKMVEVDFSDIQSCQINL